MRHGRERKCHIALADRLRADARTGWWWSAVPSGELRTKRTGALLRRMGLRPGMSDFLLIDIVGAHYWLELKARDGELSEDQADFLGMLKRRGVKCAVARGYADAIAVLKQWGALP